MVTNLINKKFNQNGYNIRSEDVDEWVVLPDITSGMICQTVSLASNTVLELDLTDLLPKDNNRYMCLFAGCVSPIDRSKAINGTISLFVDEKTQNNVPICGVGTNASAGMSWGSGFAVVGKDRKLRIFRKKDYSNAQILWLRLCKYRKMGV